METERDELEDATIEDELANLDAVLGGQAHDADAADAPLQAPGADQVAEAAAEPALDLDELYIAERVATLSGALAKAGINDVLQGAELLADSEDVAVQSAIIGLIADEDLAESMDIAAISGQLFAISELLDAVDMPVLAAFLEAKGEELHDIAVDTIFRYSAAQTGVIGADEADVDQPELAEGAAQLAADDLSELEDLLAQESAEAKQAAAQESDPEQPAGAPDNLDQDA